MKCHAEKGVLSGNQSLVKLFDDIKLQLGHNDMMELSSALSVASLVLSLVAIVIAAQLSIRQVKLMRHANEVPAFVDLLQEYRSSDFYVYQDFILNGLSGYAAENGYTGLPLAQRKQFLAMFDYMTSMACLVGFGIVGVNHIFAMYGYLFQDMWIKMLPFVEKERERTGRQIGSIVEEMCRKLSNVDHAIFLRDLRLLDGAARTFPRWRPVH